MIDKNCKKIIYGILNLKVSIFFQNLWIQILPKILMESLKKSIFQTFLVLKVTNLCCYESKNFNFYQTFENLGQDKVKTKNLHDEQPSLNDVILEVGGGLAMKIC